MVEVSPLIAFIAGLVSIASPCVLPLLPAVVGGSTGGKLRPISIVLGLALSFVLMGIIVGALGEVFSAYQIYLYIAAMFVVCAMGLYMLFDLHFPPTGCKRHLFLDKLVMKTYDLPTKGLLSGFALGMALGVIWVPCTGPVLATILTWVALAGSVGTGAYMLGIYACGFAVPMLAIAYSSRVAIRITKASNASMWLKRVAGFVLIVVGTYMVLPYIAYV